MQIVFLPNGTLVFEYGATDPAISINQTLILRPESEILASQGKEAHYHYIKTVAAVSLASLIIQDPFSLSLTAF